MDFAGPFQLNGGVKAYTLVVYCSWFGGVLFQALPSLTASDTLRYLEVAMAIVSRTTPDRIYCDAAPSLLALQQVNKGVDTTGLSDEEYINMREGLSKSGIQLRAQTAYVSFRTGRIERLVFFLNSEI